VTKHFSYNTFHEEDLKPRQTLMNDKSPSVTVAIIDGFSSFARGFKRTLGFGSDDAETSAAATIIGEPPELTQMTRSKKMSERMSLESSYIKYSYQTETKTINHVK
jgi:hypothetical protein